MELLLPRDILLSGLEKIKGTVAKADARPVLKHVVIKAKQGETRLEATNLELSQEVVIRQGEVKEPGEIALPAMKLYDIVSLAGGKEISIKLSEMVAQIRSGKANWRLLALTLEDFPALPQFDPAAAIQVPREQFLQGLNKVTYAISEDETRENLMMVLVEDGKMYATGGQRSSRCESVKLDDRIQIPKNALVQLVRLLGSSGVKDVGLCQTEQHLLFKLADDVFSTRQLEAQFPDIENMLFKVTETFSRSVKVDREILRDSVRRMKILADPGTNAVQLVAKGNNLQIHSLDNTGNESVEDMPCEVNMPVSFGVNADYMNDLLKVMSGKEMTMTFHETNPNSPMRVNQEGFVSILMPLRMPGVANAASTAPVNPSTAPAGS